MTQTKTINILGATGTIGKAAADVILANPGLFNVNLITAHNDAEGLAELAQKLDANKTILTSKEDLTPALQEPVDITLCAIVGMAGLDSMLEAIKYSNSVAIANKEPLVAAGPLVIETARQHKTQLLPIDSEHNAIYQVFDHDRPNTIEKIIITASGGALRDWSAQDRETATPEDALKHPNWSMGPKITIDSATMMNKALEIIEAHHLFNLPPEKIEIIIHHQSTIHSMVEYKDGSILAQMGASDMRTPIAHALGFPDRINSGGQSLDIKSLSNLTFEQPDTEKYPALSLAYNCINAGPAACIAFNAANEIAVDAFLAHKISFGAIMDTVKHCLDNITPKNVSSLQDIKSFDNTVRKAAQTYINSITSTSKTAQSQ